MIIEVFFENSSYSEKVAEFYSEELYMKMLPILKDECISQGFKYLTESAK
jgi:hypothetical protein